MGVMKFWTNHNTVKALVVIRYLLDREIDDYNHISLNEYDEERLFLLKKSKTLIKSLIHDILFAVAPSHQERAGYFEGLGLLFKQHDRIDFKELLEKREDEIKEKNEEIEELKRKIKLMELAE